METVIFFFFISWLRCACLNIFFAAIQLWLGSIRLGLQLIRIHFANFQIYVVLYTCMLSCYYIDTYLFLFVNRGSIMKKGKKRTNSVKWKFMANLIGDSIHTHSTYLSSYLSSTHTYPDLMKPFLGMLFVVQCSKRTNLD